MSRFMPVRSRRQGFTIIELMVVIAITGILMALVLAALQKAIAAVCDTACKNGLYNIGRAVHGHNASLQYLPVNGITAPSTPGFANASGSVSPAGRPTRRSSISYCLSAIKIPSRNCPTPRLPRRQSFFVLRTPVPDLLLHLVMRTGSRPAAMSATAPSSSICGAILARPRLIVRRRSS